MGETGTHLHVAPHQVSHARPLRVLARVCTPRLLLAHQGACAAGRRGCERGGRQAGGGRQPGGSSACTVAQPLKPLHSQHQLLPVAVVVAHGVQAGARVEAAHGAREPGVVVWPVHPHPTPVGSLARARDAGCQLCVGATGGRDTGWHAPLRAPQLQAQRCLGGGFHAAARSASPPCRFSAPQVVPGPWRATAEERPSVLPRLHVIWSCKMTDYNCCTARLVLVSSTSMVSTRTIGNHSEMLRLHTPTGCHADTHALQRPRCSCSP